VADVTALEKHACPACGAQAEWDPSKKKLICPFCGAESPYQIDRNLGEVAERDLAGALNDTAGAEQDFHEQRRSVQCQSCKAIMTFDASRVGQNCEFCGSPALIAYDAIKSPIKPEGVLPFCIDRNKVREDIRRWWRSKWLAPGRLAKAALVDTVRSVYIPYWTFDARAHCPWDADAGYYYYVSVEGRDSKGNRVTRQERRVRWEPASGVVDHAFDDELVPGTTGVDRDLLRQVEPFPTGEIVPYDTAFLAGHLVEHYQVALTQAAGDSDAQMRAALEQLCGSEVPGDTYRNLVIHPEFSARTFKHVLVPIWLLVYVFGTRSFQVVVNGYTGRIAGRYPFSPWKIAFLIALALLIASLVILSNSN
jgi:Zn finger protein HypA/HybF involved in hydrogenase expression